ncbi:cupin domain-containing protein [Kineosporia sp. J2-2]|uniref:Cupin domain-containing protein n=1 Tax=Kineosporia corallincola TaxID=2835133 RepID=A0ABS5TKN5_9ACTN|nr:cupin domain-containing protein [Kineosporia corallincola]MBT0771662.1 cupin domain-containing protein [Kineosporia corallincola]
MSAPLPGGVGLSALRVYPWEALDGLCGGSPHLHVCCTEAYLVVSGSGRLHTLTTAGFEEHPLGPGDMVWFTPGTIHRAVNDGDLRVLVLMQNSGLPEAGDAVLTFPPEHLTDRDTYLRARDLAGPDGVPSAERARRRRDLAVEGFTALRAAGQAGDPKPLEQFQAAAAALVTPVLEDWRAILDTGAAQAVRQTTAQLDALAAGDHSHLREAAVIRQERPAQDTFGMCGFLSAYPIQP